MNRHNLRGNDGVPAAKKAVMTSLPVLLILTFLFDPAFGYGCEEFTMSRCRFDKTLLLDSFWLEGTGVEGIENCQRRCKETREVQFCTLYSVIQSAF